MTLLTIFLTILLPIIILGVIMYLINTFLPMDAKFKTILNIVAVIILIIWLLKATGVLTYLGHIHI